MGTGERHVFQLHKQYDLGANNPKTTTVETLGPARRSVERTRPSMPTTGTSIPSSGLLAETRDHGILAGSP